MKTASLLIKRMSVLFFSICMLASVNTTLAVENSIIDDSYRFSLATLTTGEQVIEVPVLQRTPVQTLDGTTRSIAIILVPDMTDDSLAQNATYVAQIKKYGAPITPKGQGINDFHDRGYSSYYSELVWSTTYYQNYLRLYDILSFKLTREIHSMAPYKDLNNATAKVVQIGTTGTPENPGQMLAQQKNYGEIQYGTTYQVTEDWKPVAQTDGGPVIGVHYSIKMEYMDGSVSYLEHIHPVA